MEVRAMWNQALVAAVDSVALFMKVGVSDGGSLSKGSLVAIAQFYHGPQKADTLCVLSAGHDSSRHSGGYDTCATLYEMGDQAGWPDLGDQVLRAYTPMISVLDHYPEHGLIWVDKPDMLVRGDGAILELIAEMGGVCWGTNREEGGGKMLAAMAITSRLRAWRQAAHLRPTPLVKHSLGAF